MSSKLSEGVAAHGWGGLLASVERRRSYDARFFKPVCLLAVLDGVGDGSLAPSDIFPGRVFERFRALIAPVFPERADQGWRPFWHLSNDGAWWFFRAEARVLPAEFGPERKPSSKSQLMSKIDRVSVPPAMRALWMRPFERAQLRAALIDMLRRDDADCRAIAHSLDGDAVNVGEGETRWSAGQGFRSSAAERAAIEERAMTVTSTALATQGWEVEDVSAVRSYDLRCTRGAEILFVEVKGTSGEGDRVLLTAQEVKFAITNRARMALAVVSHIGCVPADGAVVGVGGSLRLISPWAPAPEDLDPVTYRYQLNEV